VCTHTHTHTHAHTRTHTDTEAGINLICNVYITPLDATVGQHEDKQVCHRFTQYKYVDNTYSKTHTYEHTKAQFSVCLFHGLTDVCSTIMFISLTRRKMVPIEPTLFLLFVFLVSIFVCICLCRSGGNIFPLGHRLDFLAEALMTKQESGCLLNVFK